jgi:hypothetical protein
MNSRRMSFSIVVDWSLELRKAMKAADPKPVVTDEGVDFSMQDGCVCERIFN